MDTLDPKKRKPRIDRLSKATGSENLSVARLFQPIFRALDARLTEKDFTGMQLIEPLGLLREYKKDGQPYYIKSEHYAKLGNTPPSVAPIVRHVMFNLVSFVRDDQLGKDNPEPKATFTLTDLGLALGIPHDRLAKGGKVYDDLRRALRSGAYTIFPNRIKKDDGKTYVMHGQIYTLYESTTDEQDIQIEFNADYGRAVTSWIKGQLDSNYLKYLLREAKDKEMRQDPYLGRFSVVLADLRRKTKTYTQIKGSTLLSRLRLPQTKPKKAYAILARCIGYVADNYPEYVQQVIIKHGEQKITVEAIRFTALTVEQLTEIIKPLGTNDYRQAVYCFVKGEPKRRPVITDDTDSTDLVGQIMASLRAYEEAKHVTFAKSHDQREKYLKDAIRFITEAEARRLYEAEKDKASPDWIAFVTKTLPQAQATTKQVRESVEKARPPQTGSWSAFGDIKRP